jgi:hypothetical protein
MEINGGAGVQGWVDKRSDWWHSWKKRWIVLDKRTRKLSYADSATSEEKGTFRLAGGTVTHKPNIDRFCISIDDINQSGTNDFCFKVGDQATFDLWFQALTSAAKGAWRDPAQVPLAAQPAMQPVLTPQVQGIYPQTTFHPNGRQPAAAPPGPGLQKTLSARGMALLGAGLGPPAGSVGAAVGGSARNDGRSLEYDEAAECEVECDLLDLGAAEAGAGCLDVRALDELVSQTNRMTKKFRYEARPCDHFRRLTSAQLAFTCC